jgi:peptidoglycan/xylan/chitin deacetylase (PgdA/CDA1 family)
MSELYVVGGSLRSSLFKQLPEWSSCKKAVIVKVKPPAKTAEVLVEYDSPKDAVPADSPAILFKSATVADDKLYVCTPTEVLVYKLPGFELLRYVSLPCFNDLHHVRPSVEGNILVANTGLDMVLEVTHQGKVLREWSVIGEDTWKRFSRDIDYRKVPETKPHKSHPNHVFQLGDEVWATRFDQRDAISLTRPGRRIDIGVQRPHDGQVVGDWIYFTTVDGHLVIANRHTLQVEQVFDFNIIDNEQQLVLGWCRGVAVMENDQVWVGFTRIRSTRFKENLIWVKQGFETRKKATHIALYDLAGKKCLDEIDVEPYGVDVLFSVHNAARETAKGTHPDETRGTAVLTGQHRMSIGKAAKNAAKKVFVKSGAFRFAQELAAPAAVILRYHSIQDRPDQYADTIGCDSIHATSIFERQMEMIAKGFSAVTMDDIALFLKGNKGLPPRAVAITFDDGFKDNFRLAAPILDRFGIRGTFYVLVDAVDRSRAPWYCLLRHAFWTARNPKWTDPATGTVHDLRDSRGRDAAFLEAAGICSKSSASTRDELVQTATRSLEPEPFPDENDLMMTWDDARALVKSGHIVGSHTMTHPNVAHVSAEDARSELTDSKLKLEKELGEAVKHFAYPHPALNPQWNETTLKITEELGYATAVTTTLGAVRAGARPLAIPRTYIPRGESDFLWHIERTLLFRNGAV